MQTNKTTAMESPDDEQVIAVEEENSVQETAQGDEELVRFCDLELLQSLQRCIMLHASDHNDKLPFPINRNTLLMCGIPILTADGVTEFL